MRPLVALTAKETWTCAGCRVELQSRGVRRAFLHNEGVSKRHFSTSIRQLQDDKFRPLRSTGSLSAIDSQALQTPASTSTSLPSHSAKQRWTISRQTSELMDRLLARASVASQHINSYTGTDFSGIEALRNEIVEQEKAVRSCHAIVAAAKDTYTGAQETQSSSQKEIVSLLERKSSWSAADLERYMALVRSEHLDEQTVQRSRDGLANAERELEHTRSLLEKLERKQYHEEQIWSDTIRRNSTWVTIGLMGANILLLLAQISIFEPYRRRKIVNQIKVALDERTLATSDVEAQRQVDATVAPSGVLLEGLEVPAGSTSEPVSSQPLDEILPQDAVQHEDHTASLPNGDHTFSSGFQRSAEAGALKNRLGASRAALQDLFSERVIQLKRIEITSIALEGLAAGMALSGMLMFILSRRT